MGINIKLLRALASQSNGKHPISKFVERDQTINELYQEARRSGMKESLMHQMRLNTVVSYVTILEVFLKGTVIWNAGLWNRDGIDKLMKENISMRDAFELIRTPNIKEEHIILQTQNFQNVNAIVYVFTTLLGRDFVKAMAETRKLYVQGFLTGTAPESWQSMLNECLETRHKIVHEGLQELTDEQVSTYANTVFGFGVSVDLLLMKEYDFEKYRELEQLVTGKN